MISKYLLSDPINIFEVSVRIFVCTTLAKELKHFSYIGSFVIQ